jgi:acetoin utilization deacetylase AcuC-like enzyme
LQRGWPGRARSRQRSAALTALLHAPPQKSQAAGFCYVNDIVLAILELLK